MAKELKALLNRGKKVRDRLGRLSDAADRLSAEADKVLVRPDCFLPDNQPVSCGPPSQGAHEVEAALEDHALLGGRCLPH